MPDTPVVQPQTKSKAGRKTKYNPYTVQKIAKYLSEGNNQVDSAQLSGISHETFYQWIKLYPEFSDIVNEALAQSKAVLIKRIRDASKHNWQAGSWLLERRYPQEYALKSVTEHIGKIDNQITIRIVPDIPQGISDKQLKQIESVYTVEGQLEVDSINKDSIDTQVQHGGTTSISEHKALEGEPEGGEAPGLGVSPNIQAIQENLGMHENQGIKPLISYREEEEGE